MNYEKFQQILRGSKQFEFINDTTLRITSYYTGESVDLDLTEMSEDAFEEMFVPNEENEDEE